jgi:hypothetical protein
MLLVDQIDNWNNRSACALVSLLVSFLINHGGRPTVCFMVNLECDMAALSSNEEQPAKQKLLNNLFLGRACVCLKERDGEVV